MIKIWVRIQYESTKECSEIEWNGSSQKMPVQWIMKLRKKEAQKCGNLNLLTRQLMFNQQKQQSLTATATLLRNAHISRFQIECIFLPFGMVWYGIVWYGTHSLSCIHIDIYCVLRRWRYLCWISFFAVFWIVFFRFASSPWKLLRIFVYWILYYGLEFVWFPADSIWTACASFNFRIAFTHIQTHADRIFRNAGTFTCDSPLISK